MAIQFRRGNSAEFNPSALHIGEPAVCIDTGEVYVKVNENNVKRIDNIDSGGSYNPNILHNWDFRNPVNQRGQTTYTVGGIIDRWVQLVSGSSGITLNDGYITLSHIVAGASGIYQKLEPAVAAGIAGKAVTLSVLLADGTVYAGTVTAPSISTFEQASIPVGATGYNVTLVSVTTDSPATMVCRLDCWSDATGETVDVAAIKLEMGTVSTLANDPPAEYSRQLAICQRYLLRVDNGYAMGRADSESGFSVMLPTPVTMRALPAIEGTISGALYDGRGNVHAWYPAVPSALMQNGVELKGNVNGLQSGVVQYGQFSVVLNAELN